MLEVHLNFEHRRRSSLKGSLTLLLLRSVYLFEDALILVLDFFDLPLESFKLFLKSLGLGRPLWWWIVVRLGCVTGTITRGGGRWWCNLKPIHRHRKQPLHS